MKNIPTNMIPIWNYFERQEGEHEISITDLCSRLHKSRALMCKAIREFEANGMLKVDKGHNGNSKRSTRYAVIKGE
jgi:hypothetical protein